MRDPYFNDIILNIRGYNRDVVPFRDNGPLNIPIRYTGIDTTKDPSSRFGGGFLFTNAVNSYIQFQDTPALGTSDFTIESWVRSNRSAVTDDWGAVATNYATGKGNTWGLFVRKNGELHFNVYNTSGTIVVGMNATANTVTDGINHHIAVSRYGNTFRLFLNGNMVATATNTVNIGALNTISIGQTPGFANKYAGSIEDFKITKFAKYTANFVPPSVITPTYYGGIPPNLAGAGKIAGTVKTKGVPLTSAECILFSESTNAPIAYSSTDVTGRFEFTGLNKDEMFYVVVKQNDTSWEHIVSSRRNPA